MTAAKIGQHNDDVERLVTAACERAGLDDFGADGWREGLEVLVASVESAPAATEGGRGYVYGQFVDALWNRLRIVDYLKAHPEVTDECVERPLVVLGLPRTGTSLASYLLDQDPMRRSLLTWEAEDSVPPSTADTLYTDPRCLKKKAELKVLAEGLKAANIPLVHWDEADGPTECIFVQGQDFKAYLWEAFMPNAVYADWLLEADMTSAYAYERAVLQLLQSRASGCWSLKMPSHAVHIEALLKEFPDARLVWAHRDPFKSTASFLRLNYLSRAVLGADACDVVPNVLRQLRAHVERPMLTRKRIGDHRFFDLHYSELMRDPVGVMRSLYDWAGDELTPSTEQAIVGWLQRNPQDRHGAQPYSLEGSGVTRGDLEPIFDEYLSTFDVELEDA
ncbi:sulfotransferase family protein [Mycolicibacterium tusciae]|uniref:Sulfotransferase family protein n=1 Tax=Mycolicibacterium tusciae TaxID=75922 RepID=A0A1X0JQG2_9MYCO|nr:sulfotransferase [Mycolicibacterium tusciae]ORB65002.1 sulfotransferase family protein [Mycolicibacterium tusciae]